ncbi:MAG: CvpA family protein [Desulfovibrio sp.]|nr:CvpA family protein [Desulfovibrio sp.]
MSHDIFDLVVILILVFFAGRGFLTGFIGEAASIVSLLGGFWAANSFQAKVSPYLSFLSEPMWRTLTAYVIIFIAAMLGVALLARLLQKIIALTFATWADRLAGLILGLAKGLLICSLAVLILQAFFGSAPFLKDSRIIPYLNALMDHIRNWMPDDLAARLGMHS